VSSESLCGGCLCGAIKYEIVGPPTGSMVCHCRTCRRVTAAPVVAWLSVARAHFRLLQGKPVNYRSSEAVERFFCGACGTQIFYTHRDEPHEVEVTTCSLDDANAFPPTHHSWLEHNLRWVKFGDGLPEFPKSRYDSAR
jgi:hypothetical protein